MSDHISGPRALAEPIADITDFYAFPSPEHEGHLVLVQNTLPFASPSARFSDGLIYRFRLRNAVLNLAGSQVPFAVGTDEFVIDCVFSDPTGSDGQSGTCTLSSGESVTFQVDEERHDVRHGVRVFAGPRWDPFFLDAPAALKTIATRQLAFTDPGAIYLDGKNVLSLVLEIDVRQVLGDATLFAVITETLTRGHVPGAFRAHRPAGDEEPDPGAEAV